MWKHKNDWSRNQAFVKHRLHRGRESEDRVVLLQLSDARRGPAVLVASAVETHGSGMGNLGLRREEEEEEQEEEDTGSSLQEEQEEDSGRDDRSCFLLCCCVANS